MAGKPRSVALALIDSTPVRWCSDIAAPACSNKRSPECWTAAAPSVQIKAGAARAAATGVGVGVVEQAALARGQGRRR